MAAKKSLKVSEMVPSASLKWLTVFALVVCVGTIITSVSASEDETTTLRKPRQAEQPCYIDDIQRTTGVSKNSCSGTILPYGQSCTLGCGAGYRAQGTSTVSCTSSGLTQSQFSCVALDCPVGARYIERHRPQCVCNLGYSGAPYWNASSDAWGGSCTGAVNCIGDFVYGACDFAAGCEKTSTFDITTPAANGGDACAHVQGFDGGLVPCTTQECLDVTPPPVFGCDPPQLGSSSFGRTLGNCGTTASGSSCQMGCETNYLINPGFSFLATCDNGTWIYDSVYSEPEYYCYAPSNYCDTRTLESSLPANGIRGTCYGAVLDNGSSCTLGCANGTSVNGNSVVSCTSAGFIEFSAVTYTCV